MLSEKVAIVTGASHPKGIGAAIALKLAQQGARVVLADLAAAKDQLDERVAEIKEQGGSAIAALVDVTDVEQVEASVQLAQEAFGGLDILVNNAGVGLGSPRYMENSQSAWDINFAVNVFGVHNFCHAAIPPMLARGGGVIINNSSLAGLGAITGIPAPYTASKHAVIGLTKSIASEFGKDGIRCLTFCPGSIKTQMYEDVIRAHMEQQSLSREDAEAYEVSTVPLGYCCDPSEVANVVAFLASPDASYLTGVSIPVAGGMSPGL